MAYSPGTRIGILGGGQLAKLLAQSGQHLGLQMAVLCPSAKEPAAQVTQFWQEGSPDHEGALRDFFAEVDLVTFESEFIDPRLLGQLSRELQTPVFPHPDLMAELRDRASQKTLIDNHKLPTSPWQAIASSQEAQTFFTQHKQGVVFKRRLFGYDGFGTFVVRSKSELESFLQNEFRAGEFIAEKWIPFERELAVILARSQDGSLTHLPFVESQQEDSRCDWVMGPVPSVAGQKLIKKLFKFLTAMNYVGVMGVEFFEHKGRLLINELAPRVHNTGHYSTVTNGPSQFDLHNLCLLGQTLPKPGFIQGGFAMANLIGTGAKDIALPPVEGLSWYGKEENRKGRKMGHISVTAKTARLARKKALELRQGVKL